MNHPDAEPPNRRRPRYPGTHPRKFAEKYKEHDPARHSDTVAKVLASGKTPAGSHRPILVDEVLAALNPRPGDRVADCTLGHGGHARRLLERILPGGFLLGLDADPIELPRTEARLRAEGFGPETFRAVRTNYAALPKALADLGIDGVDSLLADLGVSSMQIDDPTRGFSVKADGPLDMRMNPGRPLTAATLIERTSAPRLARLLSVNSDEPHADLLAAALAGRKFERTLELAAALRTALADRDAETRDASVRRVFQALRIEVNGEFDALESLLRALPACLRPGGRAVFLSFHSGEDRRVKHAFEEGVRAVVYAAASREVIRPGREEQRTNPRSSPAKLRWVKRAGS